MTAAALVPFLDGPGRRPLLDYVRSRLEAAGLAVFVAEQEHGDWRKGEAVRLARLAAHAYDVLVVNDADSFLYPEVYADAVDRCGRGVPWIHPHRIVARWSMRTTRALVGRGPTARPGGRGEGMDARRPAQPGGGVVILRGDVFDAVGGIDPRFVGWGGEDAAFGMALSTLFGEPVRLAATLHHLWHPKAEGGGLARPLRDESRVLLGRYRDANGDPDAMRALIAERASTVGSCPGTS